MQCHLDHTHFQIWILRIDVGLLAELLELLIAALETMASEATSLVLEVNWQKTKAQGLSSSEDGLPCPLMNLKLS